MQSIADEYLRIGPADESQDLWVHVNRSPLCVEVLAQAIVGRDLLYLYCPET